MGVCMYIFGGICVVGREGERWRERFAKRSDGMGWDGVQLLALLYCTYCGMYGRRWFASLEDGGFLSICLEEKRAPGARDTYIHTGVDAYIHTAGTYDGWSRLGRGESARPRCGGNVGRSRGACPACMQREVVMRCVQGVRLLACLPVATRAGRGCRAVYKKNPAGEGGPDGRARGVWDGSDARIGRSTNMPTWTRHVRWYSRTQSHPGPKLPGVRRARSIEGTALDRPGLGWSRWRFEFDVETNMSGSMRDGL